MNNFVCLAFRSPLHRVHRNSRVHLHSPHLHHAEQQIIDDDVRVQFAVCVVSLVRVARAMAKISFPFAIRYCGFGGPHHSHHYSLLSAKSQLEHFRFAHKALVNTVYQEFRRISQFRLGFSASNDYDYANEWAGVRQRAANIYNNYSQSGGCERTL